MKWLGGRSVGRSVANLVHESMSKNAFRRSVGRSACLFVNDKSDIQSKHRSVGRSVVDFSSMKERRKVGREGARMEGKKERAGREEKRTKGDA